MEFRTLHTRLCITSKGNIQCFLLLVDLIAEYMMLTVPSVMKFLNLVASILALLLILPLAACRLIMPFRLEGHVVFLHIDLAFCWILPTSTLMAVSKQGWKFFDTPAFERWDGCPHILKLGKLGPIKHGGTASIWFWDCVINSHAGLGCQVIRQITWGHHDRKAMCRYSSGQSQLSRAFHLLCQTTRHVSKAILCPPGHPRTPSKYCQVTLGDATWSTSADPCLNSLHTKLWAIMKWLLV